MVTKRTAATRASARVSATDKDSKVEVSSTTATVETSTSKKRTTSDEEDDREESENDDNDDDDSYSGKKATKVVKRKIIKTEKTVSTKSSSTAPAAAPALAKKASGSKVPIRDDAPTNTTMPNPLVLPPTPKGCVKIASWNVSGLNASLKKGFKTYINAENADLICIQEHKVNQPLLNIVDPKVYPFSWWGFEKEKKGYAGVAIFSKITPINVTAGLPTHPVPDVTKGRVVTLEFPTCFIVGCYVPNAGQGLVRLKERMLWDVAMKSWLKQLKDKGKQIIWTGDLNVCHKAIDLRNPSTNTMSAGFTKEERAGFDEILQEVGMIDTFRKIHGEDAIGMYSYYSYRFQCRIKGIGWRLDYFVTDEEMAKRVEQSVIREECYGASDHLPIVMVVKGSL
ncbi:hypothetical protein CPC16_003836 [Podila verticillata]|nr:hypothetical protein BGZ52_006319 [Haplosporangium bisporale]KAF9211523.1 hypothetical protein BGZ59_007950 [Podila verticillata]KAF9391871.1 hypothetical protein CPC16_003836 [Podila verticillata]KFH66332.1 hypothetical protein MVEG_08431 [Podila verticillata NRRL 6337]